MSESRSRHGLKTVADGDGSVKTGDGANGNRALAWTASEAGYKQLMFTKSVFMKKVTHSYADS